MTNSVKYHIWSHEHTAWWRANSQGYARDVKDAGVYELEEANIICTNATIGWSGTKCPPELMVPTQITRLSND